MPVRGSPDVSLFSIGGYDILGTLTEIDDSIEAITEDLGAPFGTGWVLHAYVGVRRAEISQRGYFDDAVGSAHEALQSGLGVSRVLVYNYEGTATGAHFLGFSGALETNYHEIGRRAELTKADAQYRGSGVVEQGRQLRSLKVSSASGLSTGTPVDAGASTPNSTFLGAGYLSVKSMDAIGTVTVKIIDSSDNVTYADLVTFTAVTSATMPVAERKVVTTTSIERYTALDWSFATAAAGASVTFFAGLVRNPAL